ncbi:hypothetical protein C2G38_2242489 [Gigaspora rosea]|uniref:Uncharacterized protein n=1 Tax=Gigaspora rosea TaxID=44941 RepID=A0A397VML6_9GLOM|nr:hypothetical protein C2G38_2242489 [Gigaspora rosea]
MQSHAASKLKVELKLDDKLCHKHYTDLVIFDRHLPRQKRQKYEPEKHIEEVNLNEDIHKDEKRAFEWYLESAVGRNSKGQISVGKCYQNGISISKDEKKHSNGIPRDEKKPFKWYLKSANGGNPDGQLNVRNCYRDGIGVSKDEKRAFGWYLKSASGGNSDGQLNVGNCYRNGIGTIKDEKEASEWYLKSANYRDGVDVYNKSNFRKYSKKELSELIMQHRLIAENEQPIVNVHNVQLNFSNEIININYQPLRKNTELSKLDAIVRACDETLLSQDSYRQLAGVEPKLIREHDVVARRTEITNLINEMIKIETCNIDMDINSQPHVNDDQYKNGNGMYRSIKSILTVLLPIWTKSSLPILIPGDTIKLKLGGDGHSVGRKKTTICLYVGQEKYDVLAKIGRIFEHELFDLKKNSFFASNGVCWPVELYFCGDWKFMYIIMGLNAPNAKYFCLYCNCDAESRWDMDQVWTNTGNSKSARKPSLFPAIDQEYYVPDELHLLLHLAIQLEFFKTTNNKWNWTSLMGPDKKKMLEKFPVSQFISGEREKDIEQLWREFYRLYNVLRRSQLSDQEIYQYKIDAENWVRTFCCPNQGSINSIQNMDFSKVRCNSIHARICKAYAFIYATIKGE